ncbi:MAG: 4'-phosphopantetheinyl transferase superfamily protein [Alistipes sp.]|nr:4'-phosphopantetheinyl transferase superfamily protein [Alistipes sp.]
MVRLIVEEVPPLYLCCDTLLTAQDIASASRFQNERRRNEHLAWRRIVRRELGREVVIDYDDTGAPCVDTPNIYISIAHCPERVAVAIAEERIGVDIESRERNFLAAASRFMSKEERALCHDEDWAAMVWCTKEACYKYHGKRGIDLLDDIRIEYYNPTTRRIGVRFEDSSSVEVEISLHDEKYIVAHTITE